MNKKAMLALMLGVGGLLCLPQAPLLGQAGLAEAQTPTAGAITARIRQLVNLNRNNPTALQTQLAAFLTANPSYAQYLDEAIAPLNLSATALQAIGGAMALARNNLLAAGNQAGAALIQAQIALMPLVVREQYAQGPIVILVPVDTAGEGGAGGQPPSYASFPGSLSGGGGGSSSNSPN